MNANIEKIQAQSFVPTNGDTRLLDVQKFLNSILEESSQYLRSEADTVKDNKARTLTPGSEENDFAAYIGLNRAATALQNAKITITSPIEVLRSLPIEILAEKILAQCAGVLDDEATKCRREGAPTSEKVATGIESGISLIQSYFTATPTTKLKM